MTNNLSGKRRYIALFLPLLPADRRKRRGDWPARSIALPLAFVEKQKGAMRIAAVDERALGLGITPGLTLADARARVPELEVINHDSAADALLLSRIADDLERYTPMVALDPGDAILLDVTGCSHLWGGEIGLATNIAARLAQLGITARLAIADTPDAARALARSGGEAMRINRKWRSGEDAMEISEYSEVPEDEALATLPVSALAVPAETHVALVRAGLRTLGDLAARPRSPLAARFGADMPIRLARTLGEEDRHITPRRMPPALMVEQRFAAPIARVADVLATIETLGVEAAVQLEERHGGGRRFAISLFRSDGDVRWLEVETAAPTRDPALLMRLVRERIDALSDPLDPGFGYDVIRLSVPLIDPLGPSQPDLEAPFAGSGETTALLDRLGTRLGSARLGKLLPGNHHIPELASREARISEPVPRLDWQMVECGEPALRPLHLFDPPFRVEVIAEIPDGPPRRFRWRQQLHEVTRHEGPERIASEWWMRTRGIGLTRDYYRVENSEGRRFWLFRHGLYGTERINPDWYLHGVFT